MKSLFTILLLLAFNAGTHAQVITTIAGTGVAGYSGDGGPALAAMIGNVAGIAVADNGNLFFADGLNYVIRKIDLAGNITTVAGTGFGGYSGDNGPATDAKLTLNSIAIDKKGNLYFCDPSSYRVRKIDASGIITTFAGNGSTIYSGDGIMATAGGIGGTSGICIDAIGNAYISANCRICRVDTFGVITTYAGTGTSGNTGDGGPATSAKIGFPQYISIDINGNLFLSLLYSVRKINTAGIITTFAGTGTDGSTGDGGPATAAKLGNYITAYPDKCDNVYIGDGSHNRIRKIDGRGIITSFAGTTASGYAGDGGPVSAAKFNQPYVYLNKNSDIYVVDENNYRVRKVTMNGCHSVTGVKQLTRKAEISLFPNPNTGTFTLNVSSNSNEVAHVIATNMLGCKVKEFTISTNKEQEITTNLSAGVYMLSIITSEGRHVERVVVE